MQSVQLYGPTYFHPVLSKSISICEVALQNAKKQGTKIQYHILLILTDGVINDMPQTKDAIVYAANNALPLSIIIGSFFSFFFETLTIQK